MGVSIFIGILVKVFVINEVVYIVYSRLIAVKKIVPCFTLGYEYKCPLMHQHPSHSPLEGRGDSENINWKVR